MRIWENRYNRDVQRLNLALRMIAHKARTNMICEWTGLPYERVRKLCRTYAPTHSNGGKDQRDPLVDTLSADGPLPSSVSGLTFVFPDPLGGPLQWRPPVASPTGAVCHASLFCVNPNSKAIATTDFPV